MASVFAQYLPHFAVSAFGGLEFGDRLSPLGGAPPRPSRGNPAGDAEARGRADGAAAAKADFDRQRTDDQAAFEQRLAGEREAWARETADVLAERMDAALAAIETAIVAKVARVLRRFLDGAVEARALAELSQTLVALVAGGGATSVKVTGPQALVDLLRDRLAATATPVDYLVDDRADLTVTIDDTIIETRLAAWAERIGAAVAGDDHGGSR